MTGKTHAGIGAVSYVALCDKIPGGFRYFGLAVVLVASLLPDIDHPKSILNKYILPFKNKAAKITLYACSGIITLWFNYLYQDSKILTAIGFSFLIIALSSHRNGLTHSLLGLIIFAAILGYVGNAYQMPSLIYSFMIGYGMHLLCDMLTNRGIPLFYPFKNKKVKFPFTYTVGSKKGKIIEEILMALGLIYVIYRLPFIL
jgi:inner membrane protein